MQPSRKCPKCKSDDIFVIEVWKGMTITWAKGDAYDDGVKEVGDPYRVEGECQACGHLWKFRNVIQVDESFFSV